MRYFSLFLITFLTYSATQAQSISRSVIATTGHYSSSSNGSLSATTGEVMVATFSSSNNYLTQGFQQPTADTTGGGNDTTFIASPGHEGEIIIYPNPFSHLLRLKIRAERPNSYKVQILDLLGQRMNIAETKSIDGRAINYRFNFNGLAAGMYFVNIVSPKGKVRTYKVQKLAN